MTVHPSGEYTVNVMYAVPDDAWCVELDLVAEDRTLLIAIIPDEDPAREPTVCFPSRETDIPFEVVQWFMDQVAEEIRIARGWMELRPELVDVIRQLRQDHFGNVDDEDFPEFLSKVRGLVPEADLAGVLAAAVGRRPDGTFLSR